MGAFSVQTSSGVGALLLLAAEFGDARLTRQLLTKGVYPVLQDCREHRAEYAGNQGVQQTVTALRLAAERCNIGAVEALVEFGARDEYRYLRCGMHMKTSIPWTTRLAAWRVMHPSPGHGERTPSQSLLSYM